MPKPDYDPAYDAYQSYNDAIAELRRRLLKEQEKK